uniref:Fanconi Anaemia group E protein C-terminal domain-containing protein n=1 Tax=Clastoptera arizonana TaxID=38151 RepID=A0A1B6D1J9_9HEMI
MENTNNTWEEWIFSSNSQSKIDDLHVTLQQLEETKNAFKEESWFWLVGQVNKSNALKKRLSTQCASDVDILPDTTIRKTTISQETEIEEFSEGIIQKDSDKIKNIETYVNILLFALDDNDTNKVDFPSMKTDLSNDDLKTVMQEVWEQLPSDAIRLNFVELFVVNNIATELLFQHILYPWLSEGKCTCIEAVAKLLPRYFMFSCEFLILPLISNKDSLFLRDTFLLKDLTLHLKAEDWSNILSTFVKSIDTLQRWHLPVIFIAVDNLKEDRKNKWDEVLNDVVMVMSVHVKDFSKDRDFGNILIAIINCLNVDSDPALLKHLCELAKLYAGPLKYKAISMLKPLSNR